MLSRSRSARVAGLALLLATPLTAAYATPAFSSSEIAVVGAVVTEGNVHVHSTKGLSRVTVVLCDGTTVVVPQWSTGQMSGDVAVGGVVRAVFVHSGNNTTDEAQELLALLAGADAVNGQSTGVVAIDDEDACDEPDGGDDDGDGDDGDGDDGDGDDGDDGDDDDGDQNNGGQNNGGQNNGNGGANPNTPVTNSDPAPAHVLPVNVEKSTESKDTQPGKTAVLSETFVAPTELPRTGTGHVQTLLTLALSLIGAGSMLRAAASRRVRSAPFPG